MGDTLTTARDLTCADHRDLAEAYVSGRLDDEAEVAFGTHLVTCDACFTAYLVRTVDDL